MFTYFFFVLYRKCCGGGKKGSGGAKDDPDLAYLANGGNKKVPLYDELVGQLNSHKKIIKH